MPNIKIGTSKRTDSVPKERYYFPDSVSYQPSDTFTKTKSAAFGFGTEKRKSIAPKESEKVPGPGEYETLKNSF